jgi:hypothetical protein
MVGVDVTGEELIEQLKLLQGQGTDKAVSDAALARRLGMTSPALKALKSRQEVGADHVAKLMMKTADHAVEEAHASAIKPIVEFFELDPVETATGASWRLFSTKIDGVEHPYRQGLRTLLDSHHGIYVFHDSRGRALYVGKAKRQTLWAEMNAAFNSSRALQNVRMVEHPERRQEFRSSDEVRRKIRPVTVGLPDVATYMSAYSVTDRLINELESLLIRSFPNDLLNVRMENFGWN